MQTTKPLLRMILLSFIIGKKIPIRLFCAVKDACVESLHTLILSMPLSRNFAFCARCAKNKAEWSRMIDKLKTKPTADAMQHSRIMIDDQARFQPTTNP